MTIDEMAAKRNPAYAAMQPGSEFEKAVELDLWAEYYRQQGPDFSETVFSAFRDASLLPLAIRALRNRDEPYYTQEVQE